MQYETKLKSYLSQNPVASKLDNRENVDSNIDNTLEQCSVISYGDENILQSGF